MQRFPRILLGITFQSSDRSVLHQAKRMVEYLDVETVTLVHVVQFPGDVPEAVHRQAEAASREQLESAALTFRKELSGSVRLESRVVAGRPWQELLKLANEEDYDLIVLGRSTWGPSSRLGTDAGKVIRKAPCSVLVVPQDSERPWNHILVPIAFSDRCKGAVETAAHLADSSPEQTRLTLTHVYEVPVGYNAAGRSYEEFALSMKQNARTACDEFCKDIEFLDVPHSCRLDLDPHSHLSHTHHAKHLLQVITKTDPDLIVIASQARSTGAGLLLGSSAARLVEGAEHPVLVIRRKGDNVSILQALFQI